MSQDRAVGGLPNQESTSKTTGKNYLFAIGISSYQKFDPLPNAVKDIKDLAQLLLEEYSFEQVQLLIDQEANKDNIVDKLNDLRRIVKQDDRLLIYYSGHGYMDGERGFWIPVDAEPDKVSSYVSNADVHDTLKSIKAKHLLLISDSCFSGSLLTRDVSTKMEGAFEEWDRKPSRFVFISGGGPVSDGKPGENSPFANGIINNLKENEEDTINICRLADRVTEQVRYNYKQQAEVSPLFDAGHMGGQFVFVKKRTEAKEWQYALQEDTEGGYIAFYNNYPNGKYATEAKQKLKDLAAIKETEEDEKEWQKALAKDSAIYYLQYLENHPNAKHKEEARTNLERIKEEDRREKEAERKKDQEKRFLLEKEKREKDLEKQKNAAKEKPSDEPRHPTKSSNTESIPTSSKPKKFLHYLNYIAIVLVLSAATYVYFNNRNSPENKSTPQTSPPSVTDLPIVQKKEFDGSIKGKVIDAKGTPLQGATIRIKQSDKFTISDSVGNFSLTGVKEGDSLFASLNFDYGVARDIVIKDFDTYKMMLSETAKTQSATASKNIIGQVTDRFGLPLQDVKIKYKYGERNANTDGGFTLNSVKQGYDIDIQAPGYPTKTIAIGKSNEYYIQVIPDATAKEHKNIYGYIRDNEGRPKSRAYIEMISRKPRFRNAYSDENGKFIIYDAFEGEEFKVEFGSQLVKKKVTDSYEYVIILN